MNTRIERLIRAVVGRYRSRQPEEIYYTHAFRISKRNYITASIFILILGAIVIMLHTVSSGNYLTLWLFWCMFVLVVFTALSAPQRLSITNKNITIEGVLGISVIPLKNIVSIEKFENKKGLIPIFCSLGFLGNYGYYFLRSHNEITKLISSKSPEQVVIRVRWDVTYIVGVDSAKEFIEKYQNSPQGEF